MESYKRTVYVTVDGKEFYDENEATAHEETLNKRADALDQFSPHFNLIEVPYNHPLRSQTTILYIALIKDQQGVEEINFVCKVRQITNGEEPIEFTTPGKFVMIGSSDLYYIRIKDISFYRDIDLMIGDFISNHIK